LRFFAVFRAGFLTAFFTRLTIFLAVFRTLFFAVFAGFRVVFLRAAKLLTSLFFEYLE
jgi:hypothetical protein